MNSAPYQDFGYSEDKTSHMHPLLLPHIMELAGADIGGARVLDVGCGKGAILTEFLKLHCTGVGIDLSDQGIALARKNQPKGRFEVLSADDHILDHLQTEPFDLVVSTEVVEHLYAPRTWAKGCFNALKPGGHLICSTPYHGYLKNLLLSVFGHWDQHANPLWDGGHIKLWSRRTLSQLLEETGFEVVGFKGVGRVPGLWMTMLVTARKPI